MSEVIEITSREECLALLEGENPFWEQQVLAFEEFAHQFADAPDRSRDEMTTEALAAKVLWWANGLREHMEHGDPGKYVAHAAMRLSGTACALYALVHEAEILVGRDQIARPERMQGSQPTRAGEHQRWRMEADLIRAERPDLSALRIAELVKNRLTLPDKIRTIRRRL